MYMYTHQCMFCQACVSYYPSRHVRFCPEQLKKAPVSLLRAYFAKTRDYFSHLVDSTDDFKTTAVPNDKNYKLVKPVPKVYRGEPRSNT